MIVEDPFRIFEPHEETRILDTDTPQHRHDSARDERPDQRANLVNLANLEHYAKWNEKEKGEICEVRQGICLETAWAGMEFEHPGIKQFRGDADEFLYERERETYSTIEPEKPDESHESELYRWQRDRPVYPL